MINGKAVIVPKHMLTQRSGGRHVKSMNFSPEDIFHDRSSYTE